MQDGGDMAASVAPKLQASFVVVDPMLHAAVGPVVLPIMADGRVDIRPMKRGGFKTFTDFLERHFEQSSGLLSPPFAFRVRENEDGSHRVLFAPRSTNTITRVVRNGVRYEGGIVFGTRLCEVPLKHGDHLMLYYGRKAPPGPGNEERTFYFGPLSLLYELKPLQEEATAAQPLVPQLRSCKKVKRESAPPLQIATKKEPTLMDMPDEVLRMILSHLPVNFIAYYISAVNKKFYNLVKAGFYFDRAELQYPRTCLSLRAQVQATLLKGLSEVVIRGMFRGEDEDEIGWAASAMVSIFYELCREVKSIELHFANDPGFRNFTSVVKAMKGACLDLKSLKISGADPWYGWDNYGYSLPTLEYLRLEHKELFLCTEGRVGHTVLDSTPNLKTLILHGKVICPFWDAAKEEQLWQLTRLDAEFASNIPIYLLPQLQILSLKKIPSQRAKSCLHKIAELKNLKALSLSITDPRPTGRKRRNRDLPHHQPKIYKWLPKDLSTLVLKDFGIDAQACEVIAMRCPKLEHVVLVSRCPIGEAGVRAFVENCRNLVWFNAEETVRGWTAACDGIPPGLQKNGTWEIMIKNLFEGV